MQFCPECESILLPKRNSNDLFCRVCNKTFKAEKGKADYKMKSKIEKDRVRSKTAVVETRSRTQSISEEERRAFEDYFTGGE
jgi:DNA-directed RNA polymerase subunit M/transcription elongation factor TFIIS